MELWVKVMVLSLGGALGVNVRYWMGAWISRWASPQFPWPTFTINVSGSFAIGFLAVLLARWLPHPNIRLLVIVGFLGGYTTFSSYSYEALTLTERGGRRSRPESRCTLNALVCESSGFADFLDQSGHAY